MKLNPVKNITSTRYITNIQKQTYYQVKKIYEQQFMMYHYFKNDLCNAVVGSYCDTKQKYQLSGT